MAFRIHGEVTLDGSQFARGLHEISGETTEFFKNFALGAIGIASVEQAFDKTIESASELVDTSKKLDLTVEQLQVLRQAAEENGQEFETMTHALERFNAVRENVLRGGKGSADQMAALQRLGLSRQQLQDQTAAQSLMGQISGTAQKSNAADIANDLNEVFGRNGEELFGVLKTDFVELEDKMKSFGAIMDTTTAVELKGLKDEMAFLGNILIAEFAPAIILLGKGIYEVVTLFGVVGTTLGNFAAELVGWLSFGVKPKWDSIQAGGDYWDKNQKIMADFDARQAAIADSLNHPKPPAVNLNEDFHKEKALKEPKQIKTDSLLEVGNFLGSGASSINGIAQQQLDVSRKQLEALNKVELNTAAFASYISGGGGIDFGS